MNTPHADHRLVEDILKWGEMVEAIEAACTATDAAETALQANGYLRCLYDVGLIGVYQRDHMAVEIQEACAKRVLQDRKQQRRHIQQERPQGHLAQR